MCAQGAKAAEGFQTGFSESALQKRSRHRRQSTETHDRIEGSVLSMSGFQQTHVPRFLSPDMQVCSRTLANEGLGASLAQQCSVRHWGE